nr:unnamed protein product [Callosobruchus analis]
MYFCLSNLCAFAVQVVLCAQWASQKRPYLSGGPLDGNYRFAHARFRWGPNDNEGSEHMLNCTRYAMELQAAFVKTSMKRDDVLEAARCGWLVFLSYVFMVTPTDNPYLEPIVKSLSCLKCPCSYVCIDPIILSLLMPEFCRDYYSYVGSLSYPPCTEGVRWIVKPEPLMISSGQLQKFRKLHAVSGLMDNNTRPVQMVNNRDVMYYD